MQTLDQLRDKIEQLDAAIIEKLAERKKLSLQIGQLKTVSGINVLDTSRELQLKAYYQILSEKYHLDPTFVLQIFELIFAYSRNVQDQNARS